MALNQAFKDADFIKQRWPNFRMPGWVNYVPLAFLVMAVAAHYIKPTLLSGTVEPVVSGVPIDQIARILDGATTAQAEELMKPFKGKSVRVSGVISNVSSEKEFTIAWLDGAYSGYPVTAIFRQTPNPSQMSKGDALNAECKFGYLSQSALTLNECHLR